MASNMQWAVIAQQQAALASAIQQSPAGDFVAVCSSFQWLAIATGRDGGCQRLITLWPYNAESTFRMQLAFTVRRLGGEIFSSWYGWSAYAVFYKKISIVKLLLLTAFVCALLAGKPWEELYQAAPLEKELVREGPLDVETIRGRNAAVRFIRKDGDGRGFLVASYAFNQGMEIFSLIEEQRKKGIVHAYLWTHHQQDGEVTVWRIDINDINILSYEKAEKNVKRETWLYKLNRLAAGFFAISLLLSFIRWKGLTQSRRNRGR